MNCDAASNSAPPVKNDQIRYPFKLSSLTYSLSGVDGGKGFHQLKWGKEASKVGWMGKEGMN